MEGEDDGLVPGKDHVVILVGEPVGVGGVGLELHQIHHIHHPQPHLGQVAAQDGHRCQGLQRGGVAAAGQHRVGLRPWSLEAHCQMPMPWVQCLMASSMVSHWGRGCLEATITLT